MFCMLNAFSCRFFHLCASFGLFLFVFGGKCEKGNIFIVRSATNDQRSTISDEVQPRINKSTNALIAPLNGQKINKSAGVDVDWLH